MHVTEDATTALATGVHSVQLSGVGAALSNRKYPSAHEKDPTTACVSVADSHVTKEEVVALAMGVQVAHTRRLLASVALYCPASHTDTQALWFWASA